MLKRKIALTLAITVLFSLAAYGNPTQVYAKSKYKNPTYIAPGEVVKVDLNGDDKKEKVSSMISIHEKDGCEYTRYQLKIGSKVVKTKDFAYGGMDFYWGKINKKSKYKELLIFINPSDVSNSRCYIYRYIGKKLVPISGTYKLPKSDLDSRTSYKKVGYILSHSSISYGKSIRLYGNGIIASKTATGFTDDNNVKHKWIKYKVNNRFKLSRA